MNLMGYCVLMVIMAASAAFTHLQDTVAQSQKTETERQAVSFLLYSQALDNILKNDRTVNGEVTKSLNLPAWLGRDKNIRAYISGGYGYLYTQNTPGLLDALKERTDNSFMLGVTDKGRIITRGGIWPSPEEAERVTNSVVYIR